MNSPAKTALIYLWAPFGNVLWYVETIVMGTISLLVWPFDATGELQHACARWWCRMVAVTIGARIHMHGAEQVQAHRSYVYVANHSSRTNGHLAMPRERSTATGGSSAERDRRENRRLVAPSGTIDRRRTRSGNESMFGTRSVPQTLTAIGPRLLSSA